MLPALLHRFAAPPLAEPVPAWRARVPSGRQAAGRDEDARVRARDDADEQDERQVLERARSQQVRADEEDGADQRSAVTDVLIDRTRVWFTEKLAASLYVCRLFPVRPAVFSRIESNTTTVSYSE